MEPSIHRDKIILDFNCLELDIWMEYIIIMLRKPAYCQIQLYECVKKDARQFDG